MARCGRIRRGRAPPVRTVRRTGRSRNRSVCALPQAQVCSWQCSRSPRARRSCEWRPINWAPLPTPSVATTCGCRLAVTTPLQWPPRTTASWAGHLLARLHTGRRNHEFFCRTERAAALSRPADRDLGRHVAKPAVQADRRAGTATAFAADFGTAIGGRSGRAGVAAPKACRFKLATTLQRCPALRTAEMLLNAMDIKGGVSTSGRSGADDCVCGLRSGGGGDLAFATVVRLRRRDLSSRNSALSAFSSLFSFLIFLSFFDITRRGPRRGAARAW